MYFTCKRGIFLHVHVHVFKHPSIECYQLLFEFPQLLFVIPDKYTLHDNPLTSKGSYYNTTLLAHYYILYIHVLTIFSVHVAVHRK